MKSLRMAIAFCLVALMMLVGISARADNLNKLTYLTFDQPVELPGNVVLQPGTYAFTVLETFGFRHIVQVFNKDRTHLYATILAIPNYRVKASEQTVVKFAETPAGSPGAIKEWFYPGNGFGQEFVYPKNRAVELAKVSNEPVPSMPTELTPDITKPAVKELEKAPVTAEEPSGQEVEVAQAFETTPPPAELPKTGSSVPLIGLLGLFFVSSAAVLRRAAKNSV